MAYGDTGHSKGGALGHSPSGGVVKPAGEKSSPSHSAIGSGSHPGGSKVKIPDSMDGVDPHQLGRAPSGWLK